ncbi:hypothetical protein BSLA_02f0829 [Burkholderia stabilis]|nr:hypothetical protein BSLA_02f0829 [Burkholderia stabilis]
MAAQYARFCFTRESWGQENTPDDGRTDAIRYDETIDKSEFCGIVDAKPTLNRHVSSMGNARITA